MRGPGPKPGANQRSERHMMIHRVGRFTFDDNTGEVTGPKSYLETEAFQQSFDKIQSGRSSVIYLAPAGIPLGQLVATALQTDFAAWLGQERLKRGLSES